MHVLGDGYVLCVLMCVLDDEMNFTSFDLKIE